MPAMPYIQPIPKWIEEELNARAKDQSRLIRTTPFVMLTSPAVVTKKTQTKENIVNEQYDAEYYGCVLSNTTDISKLYQTGNSIIGYDLNGKSIEVIGESNRKISVPLIIDLQIEEAGENASLKTAKLNIKVFSLKQLEMFELFFLRPGMEVVLEYGNNSDLLDKNIEIKSKMFPKDNFESFKKEFLKVFSPLDADWPKIKEGYLKKLEDTKGNYNVWLGKVTTYSFSVDTDGTYNIMIEVSAGNELASQILSQTSKSEGTTPAKIESNNYKSYVAKINQDFDTKFTEILNEKDWKNEFFNWGIESKKTEDNTISKNAYISVRLALHIINKLNPSIGKIVWGKYNKDGKDIDLIPVSSTKYIMSSDERVIFPGIMPNIYQVSSGDDKGKIVIEHDQIAELDANGKNTGKKLIKIKPGKPVLINGYSFNVDDSDNIKNFRLPTDDTNVVLPKDIGNLLNVFIMYDTFVSMHKNSIKISDVLTDMLVLIQQNMYGYSYFELSLPDSTASPNTGLTIIDRKLKRKLPNSLEDIKPYRFKVGPTNSIVHNFSFDFQMSDLMAGQTIYASQLAVSNASAEVDNGQAKQLNYPETLFTSANMNTLQNADGYYSINPIEVPIQKAIYKKQEEDKIKEVNKQTAKEKADLKAAQEKEKKENITQKVKAGEEALKTNFIRFKLKNTDKTASNLIYTDAGLLKYYLIREPEPDTVLVSGVDINIAIDGISGLSTGCYFHIDGVPEVYNKNGVFQIIGIQHGINSDGWLTTINATWSRKQ